MNYREFFLETASDDYRGEHSAPDKTSGSPMHNLTGTYPDDIYGPDAVRLYGDGNNSSSDAQAISTIKSTNGRPNAPVKIYRAVPKILSRDDKIADIENQKRYIQKYGKVPPTANTALNRSKYYDVLSARLEELNKLPPDTIPKIKIENGNWVTINREYAVEHGQSSLGNQFRILSKTTNAKYLFTDGNSIHEWGYDAS